MDFQLPELGEGIYEAEMLRWLVKEGDTIRRSQGLLEVMTDKATMEVPAPFAGKITQLIAEAGQKVKVGDTILKYLETNSDSVSVATNNTNTTSRVYSSTASEPNGKNRSTVVTTTSTLHSPPAAPSVRHLARKLGIDLNRVTGTGPGGRILIDDLTTVLKSLEKPAVAATPEPQTQQFDVGKPGTRIKLQGLRRKIAEHMMTAKNHIPQYSYIDEYDITDMVHLRQALREPCAKRGLKLTYLAFFVKATVLALKEIPIVNSSLDEKTDEIYLHDRYNIGIAVATSNGLIVPVIKDADKKDLFTIASEIDRLGNEAKNNRIKLEDLRGGTFTITSIGNIGGLISTPIINHPEVGIMGIGKVVKRPVYDDAGKIKPAETVYLSFSFDHRVVDGAIGAMFGNAVMRSLQAPVTMMLPDRLK